MTFARRITAPLRAVNHLFVTPFQRRWLDITAVHTPVYRLAPQFDGYRIAQFSDIHLDGRMMTRARLEDLVAQINAQQPDLIAFTGDFVTKGIPFCMDDLIEPLRELKARDGVVAVLGNHDHPRSGESLERVIHDSGMIDLDNAVHTVRRGDDCLHFAGVDSLSRHRARLDLVLQQLPEAGAAILLAHEPEFADVSAATRRFALQLSGHTHGGQIYVPGLTRWLVNGYSRQRVSGGRRVGYMLLYINRGIGTTGIPLRFNCAPELTTITLHAYNPPEQAAQV